MAEDRWNDDYRYNEDPLWGEGRRRERRMAQDRTFQDRTFQDRTFQDRDPADYDRYRDDRPRPQAQSQADDDTRYRPFGDTGPISTRSGAYTGEGQPYRQDSYGRSGRYDDLSPNYRTFEAGQRRVNRGDYDPDRYTPNPREGRGEEARSWWDRTQDEVTSWFGDENARRRREWDERQADVRHDQREAEHRGRGPRGYKRSDARIAEDINDRLTDDAYIDASDIDVSVKDGEVTLSGLVSRRDDKRRAEDLAETILGVGHVQNNLRVRPAADTLAADNTLI